MRRKHRGLVYDGVAAGERLILQRARNPERGYAEGRLVRGRSGKRRRRKFGTDGEHLVCEHFPARNLDAAQRNDIFAGFEAHIVGDMNGRNDEAELQSEIAAQRFDARQKLPALAGIDQRHQPVADFEAKVRRA